MRSLGSHLRELREQRGVSLEEMSRITRVALRYLEALEADDHGALLEPVFTRGFIRAYCQALREPPGEALALYPATESTRATTAHPPTGGRSFPAVRAREGASQGTVFVSFVLLVVFGLGLFGLTLVLQSGKEDGGERRPAAPSATATVEPRPAPSAQGPDAPPRPAPGASTPAPPTPAPSASPSPRAGDTVRPPSSSGAVPPAVRTGEGVAAPSGGTTTPPGAPPPAVPPPASPATGAANAPAAGSQAELARLVASVSSPYRLVARASEPTWVRVRMGDGRAVEETMGANEVREWVSNQPFVLTIGNAGGISLELNGRALPSLGPRGGVVGRIVIPPPNDAGPPAAKSVPNP
jgi:cytoskeleton protein RodZ